ncbi:MAG: hypothetical protein ACREOF_16530 [Gemmatimonadales bacterium]
MATLCTYVRLGDHRPHRGLDVAVHELVRDVGVEDGAKIRR